MYRHVRIYPRAYINIQRCVNKQHLHLFIRHRYTLNSLQKPAILFLYPAVFCFPGTRICTSTTFIFILLSFICTTRIQTLHLPGFPFTWFFYSFSSCSYCTITQKPETFGATCVSVYGFWGFSPLRDNESGTCYQYLEAIPTDNVTPLCHPERS